MHDFHFIFLPPKQILNVYNVQFTFILHTFDTSYLSIYNKCISVAIFCYFFRCPKDYIESKLNVNLTNARKRSIYDQIKYKICCVSTSTCCRNCIRNKCRHTVSTVSTETLPVASCHNMHQLRWKCNHKIYYVVRKH